MTTPEAELRATFRALGWFFAVYTVVLWAAR